MVQRKTHLDLTLEAVVCKFIMPFTAFDNKASVNSLSVAPHPLPLPPPVEPVESWSRFPRQWSGVKNLISAKMAMDVRIAALKHKRGSERNQTPVRVQCAVRRRQKFLRAARDQEAVWPGPSSYWLCSWPCL